MSGREADSRTDVLLQLQIFHESIPRRRAAFTGTVGFLVALLRGFSRLQAAQDRKAAWKVWGEGVFPHWVFW